MEDKKVILAVGAHADDMDFTSSGTVAKFAQEGNDCYYLVCTDGSHGSSDPEMTCEKLIATRQQEQIEAGKLLGLKDVFFLDYPDTELNCDQAVRRDIVKIIRKVKPDIVITWDPTMVYVAQSPWGVGSFINHSDHRACGQATMDAVFPYARDRLTYPEHEAEGLEPHSVKELWLVAFDKPNHYVDITETFNKKCEAIAAHASQFSDMEGTKKKVTSRAESYGKEAHCTYAEGFTRLVLE